MIKKTLKLKNYTVFNESVMNFSKGINILIGENGTGKTHILKLLYSAAQSVYNETSFSHKLAKTMLQDDYDLSHLVSEENISEENEVYLKRKP